jgi:GNAT superfamily N-acetyltransferase
MPVTTTRRPAANAQRPGRAWVVTPVRPTDHDAWAQLFRAYARFYRVELRDGTVDVVWSWLHDPGHQVDGLVVRRTYAGPALGLAHYRPFPRTLRGTAGCYLDDLYVDPSARGGGAAPALLAHLRRLAAARGWGVVRWLTAPDNERARTVYDRVAAPTPWISYDMQVA